MKSMNPLYQRHDVRPALFCLCLIAALLAGGLPVAAPAQPAEAETPATTTAVSTAGGTNASGIILAGSGTNRAVRLPRNAGAALAGDTNASTLALNPDMAKAADTNSDEIQLSFQGADINMVVQWLMQTTGKTVLKSQQVQGQVNVTNSKKLPKRQAIDMVYRALAMENISVTETANYIALTREGQEPKVGPELLGSTATNVPDGRQRMIKMFPLSHAQAGDLRDRIRIVLSEKATVDVDDRGNQLIVTDYNDNLRVLTELMKELDVTATSDFTLQIYPLKYAEAEEVGNLISMILNAQAPPPPSPRPSPGSSSSSRSSSSMPSMAMVIGGSDSGSPSPSPSGGGSGGGSASGGQQVRIWSDKNANRLIVSAPRSKLPEVERLVGILDTNKPEDVAVRVLPLKHVAAVDVVKEIGDLYKTLSGRSLKEVIQITADDQSNSLIILSSEANFHNIERLMKTMDTEDAQDKTMKTFVLKNADATDVAKQLQDLNTDQSGSSRYNYNIYYNSPSSGGKSKKMTVVADRRRNAVIVQAPPAQMDGIEQMIKQLDQSVDDESLAPKVYQLKYVSATDIEDVLNELFLKKTQQRSYWDYNTDEYFSSRTDQDAGRLYGKVRITSEPYSNTIIVTSNSKENLDVVENVLKQLDQPAEGGESTLRIGLRFAKADVLAKNLNILFARNGSPGLQPRGQQQQSSGGGQQQQQQQQSTSSQTTFDLGQDVVEEGYYSWLGGAGDSAGRGGDGRGSSIRFSGDLVDRVRVVPDRRGNALLVSARPHLLPQILKLINGLDDPADQVLIEARLLEVSSDFLDKLGVRWSPDGSKVFTADDFDNSIIAHVTADYQKGFGPLTTVNQPLSPGTVAQSLTALRSGVLSSTINMDFLVQFLKKTTDATVLAEPQINIRDNETGRLFVGQEVPVPQSSQFSSVGSQNTTITYKNVGITLEVTPHINNSGDVELKVHAEASTTVPGVTVLGGAVFDTRAFRTDLRAKDGETLILGGIIQKQIADQSRKTPFFGSIPVLGWAFKKKDKTTHEVELMVFLRPRVVRNSEDARELMREMDKRAPLIKKWEEDSQAKEQEDKKK